MAVREWLVGGALVESEGGILLVRNRRPGGASDWSTPGGVIDASDRDLLAGLGREVAEETGLRVRRWEGPVYEVVAHAPGLGWRMRCEVHRALRWEGDLRVEDPDGIVVEAAFVSPGSVADRLSGGAPWVREPLAEWCTGRWPASAARAFRYEVRGTRRDALRVERAGATV